MSLGNGGIITLTELRVWATRVHRDTKLIFEGFNIWKDTQKQSGKKME